MEVGHPNKLGIIIQARMKSERLPGKVLRKLQIDEGDTILGQIINSAAKLNGVIVVATSTDESNFPILDFCNSKNILCFKGDEENVLGRFTSIQSIYEFDNIIRLTADNPFIDYQVINEVLDYHVNNDFDYTISKGLPLGMNIEIMKGKSLMESENLIEFESDKEHVTPILRRNSKFKNSEYIFNLGLHELRVTVDTIQDYMVACLLYNISYQKNISGIDLMKYVKINHEWIFEANKNIIQKNSQSNKTQEFKDAVILLRKYDFFKSADFIEKSINNE